MQTIYCSKCGTPNRVGARFCARCAAPLAGAPAPVAAPPAPVTPQRPAPQYPAPQPTVAPAIQPAPSRDVALLARGCGAVFRSIARVVTLGGRAAYADLLAAEPVVRGQIVSPPNTRQVPAPIEIGCLGWGLAWLLAGLPLLLPEGWATALAFAALYFIVLILCWSGLRHPFFSRLTLSTLRNFITRRQRGVQPQMEFALQTQQGQPMTVALTGSLNGLTAQTTPQLQHLVQLWGIRTGSAIRAWKLEFLHGDYRPAGVWLSTARLIPLSAGLFIPLTAWLVFWVVKSVLQWLIR